MPYLLFVFGLIGGFIAGYFVVSAIKDKELEGYKGLQRGEEALKDRFKSLSNEVLDKQSKDFKGGVESVVEGVTRSMKDIEKRMLDFETQRANEVGSLKANIQSVLLTGQEMHKEVHILKAVLSQASAVRGRWGEAALKSLLEASGLTENIDFYLQETVTAEESALRPDVIVNLPGGLKLAIDSKAGLEEYFKSVEESDETKKKAHLQKLALNIRTHIKNLSSKEYQKHLDDRIPYVIMFIPGEGAMRAVFDIDHELFREAQAKKVMLASPATIMPMILLIAHAWKQQKTVENASILASEITELASRLKTFVGHIVGIGSSISGATKKFNEAISSWDTRVSPKIEQINVLGGNMQLDENIARIDVEPRSSSKLLGDAHE